MYNSQNTKHNLNKYKINIKKTVFSCCGIVSEWIDTLSPPSQFNAGKYNLTTVKPLSILSPIVFPPHSAGLKPQKPVLI